jgi:hypothetical protein
MAGDERVRFCDQCNLYVYNISEMSRDAAIALVTQTEGRLCARFYRRPDGTVLTKDCPVGLRAVRVRVSRAASAVFSAILSLLSGATARATPGTYLQDSVRSPITIKQVVRPDAQDASASLACTINDPNGAMTVSATIILLNNRTKEEQRRAYGPEGVFRMEGLEPGEYTLTVESPGFRSVRILHLSLNSRESVRVDVTLEVAAWTMGDISSMVFDELKGEAWPLPGEIKPREIKPRR